MHETRYSHLKPDLIAHLDETWTAASGRSRLDGSNDDAELHRHKQPSAEPVVSFTGAGCAVAVVTPQREIIGWPLSSHLNATCIGSGQTLDA